MSTPDASIVLDASLAVETAIDQLALQPADAAETQAVDRTSIPPVDLAEADALETDAFEARAFEAGPECPAAFAGCDTFVDSTAPDADRAVHFHDYSYDPKCLMIRAGQTVTFAGDFIVHPLTPSCGPDLLLYYRDVGATASFVLTVPGIYGYYCLDHGNAQGQAMAGAIDVVP